MTEPAVLAVTESAENTRFEGRVHGQLVGLIDYIPLPGKVIATHTEVAEEHEGKGYGSQLVRGMVDHLRADGRLLQPLCPYVSAWLRRHPDQSDIVDPSTPS